MITRLIQIGFAILVVTQMQTSNNLEEGVKSAPQPVPTNQPPNLVQYTTFAAHYGEGTMTRVANFRGLTPSDCMISTPLLNGPGQPSTFGEYATVTSLVTGFQAQCQVVDTSQDIDTTGRGITDRQWHLQANRLVELNAEMIGPICNFPRVGYDRPEACPVILTIGDY